MAPFLADFVVVTLSYQAAAPMSATFLDAFEFAKLIVPYPLLWAKQIIEHLGVFQSNTLESWYEYFRTGAPVLMSIINQATNR